MVNVQKIDGKEEHVFIDGLDLGKHDPSFGGLVMKGFEIIFILILTPIWIIPYLLGKIVTTIGRKQYVSKRGYVCPKCKRFGEVVRDGTKLVCEHCLYTVDVAEVTVLEG